MMSGNWDFVIAAYGVSAIGTAILLIHSWSRMRSAEQRVAQMQSAEQRVAQMLGDAGQDTGQDGQD